MAVSKKGKRELESEKKKQLIIDTALAMFRQYGYENTTMSDISTATGISNGSIYHFFGSKEGIVTAAARDLYEFIIEEDSDWDRKTADPAPVIYELLTRYSEYFVTFGRELSQHLGKSFYRTYNERNGDFIRTPSVLSLMHFIEACQERGTISTRRSADEYAQIILTLLQSVLMRWTRFEFDLMEKLSKYYEVILTDLLP